APSADGGTIHGKVLNADGEAIADANVYVVDGSKKPVASTRTKADGTYELAGLPMGDGFRIMASSVGYESEYNDDAGDFEEAAPKQIRRGRTEVNFVLTKVSSGIRHDNENVTTIAAISVIPNPFTTTAILRVDMPVTSDVVVTVVDPRGSTVAIVHRGVLVNGTHELRWNGRSSNGTQLESGVYFVRIDNGRIAQSYPLILAR
ncbi:MAG: carboxypeptidase regulatory-like domain-containing protein, partial [bacterium]|nr:carboxypeptidase regulatory-like domain-containing protein [Candidatus Kapabacteria bacterium]